MDDLFGPIVSAAPNQQSITTADSLIGSMPQFPGSISSPNLSSFNYAAIGASTATEPIIQGQPRFLII